MSTRPAPPGHVSAGVDAATRRSGRPPRTSARELELVAMRLFAEQGYEDTTVAQIAAAAGVSGRTFFRYFDSKPDVLWGAFDQEVASIRDALAQLPPDLPVMAAVRRAVLAVNHYQPADVPELRQRMTLIAGRAEIAASANAHYEAWEQAVRDFVAVRSGQPADSLYPLAVGRATLATCRAAYERWATRADADLAVYLDAALSALAAGFGDAVLLAEPTGPARSAP
jgi:mycofactocin system transcriptional regulator